MFPYQPKKKDYYLYIGRMIERKGIDIASQMCKEIGAKLIMAGPGNYIPEYGEYIGPVDSDKRAELMGGAIAVIAPTTYVEPFGNIVPEAHFCGTPTITTDWGAFVETNVNGVTGYRCRTLDEFCKAAEDVKKLNPKVIHDLAMATYSVDVIKYKYDKYFKGLLTLWDKGWYTRL
jgi:glycosyltransferase involved in cell wall biosynthesis